MSQAKILISVVEYYSHLKNISACYVFRTFWDMDFTDLILDSQQNFPDMDLDFYIGMLDGMTALEEDASENEYQQYETRTKLLVNVVGKLSKAFSCSDLSACKKYYDTELATRVAIDETKLYEKSADEIFDMVMAELNNKNES